jgi:hypothetical protein
MHTSHKNHIDQYTIHPQSHKNQIHQYITISQESHRSIHHNNTSHNLPRITKHLTIIILQDPQDIHNHNLTRITRIHHRSHNKKELIIRASNPSAGGLAPAASPRGLPSCQGLYRPSQRTPLPHR